MRYIGIDVGKAGSIAVIGDGFVDVKKMPATEKDIFDLIVDFAGDGECFAIIERVRSSPQMGVTSAFTFGRGYGGLIMALVGASIPYEEVLPAKWQKSLGCLSGGDKNITKARAQGLFPKIKVTHVNADALLIATFNKTIYHGGSKT